MTVDSTVGGSVIDPGEGTYSPYDEGALQTLNAVADTGYMFLEWTGDVGDIDDPSSATTFIFMNADATITAVFYEPNVDPGNSSASWEDNVDGTGTMSLIVRDQHDNPMPGFGMDDIAVRNPLNNVYTLTALDATLVWTVDDFTDHGDGTYTVELDRTLDQNTLWDVIVDGIDIEEDMPVVITGN